jgi:hypothetical protein
MFNGISGMTGAEDVSPGVSRNSLASHKNTTRPLYVLCAPTNRPIPDSKMVTGCAKCVRRPQVGLRPSGACPVPPFREPAQIMTYRLKCSLCRSRASGAPMMEVGLAFIFFAEWQAISACMTLLPQLGG